MNKRLRKKFHLAEVSEWASNVDIRLTRADASDDFFDHFILDAIEANGCICGGGGQGTEWGYGIVLGRMADDPNGKLAKIRAWFDSRSDVAGYKIGPLVDAWHVQDQA
jgi:uncharacterized protein YggL (DUF469 family)